MSVETYEAVFWTAMVTFLIAGVIKGTIGIGLPTTAIGILSQFTDVRLAITLAVLPIVAGNGWQMIRAGNMFGTAKRYAIFAVFLIVVLFVTAVTVTNVPTQTLIIMLGIVIVLFSLISLSFSPPRLPDRWDKPAQAVAGSAAGILGGMTAIWAPPVMIYFLARRLEKDEFIRATALLLLAGSLPLLAGYLVNGQLVGETGKLSAILIIPTLVGFTFGEYLRSKLNAERFRTAVLVMFLLMGLNLLRRAFFG